MNIIRIVLIIYINSIGSFSLIAQLSDEFYVENEDSSLFRNKGIIECHSFITEFENGIPLKKHLESVEKYNEYGLIFSVLNLNSESDSSEYMIIRYDSKNRMSSIKWFWYDEGKVDWIDSIVYTFDEIGQAIQECIYTKTDGDYSLEYCESLHYIDGKLDKITNENNDTVVYYQYVENKAYGLDSTHRVISYYSDGRKDYLIHDSSKFSYTRDSIGNIIFATNVNMKSCTFTKILIEYKDGLPIKSTQYDEYGNTMWIRECIYKKK